MNRPIYILAGVMVVGIAVWLLLSNDPNRVTEKQTFLTVDTATVDYVHIVNKDGSLTLKKVGSNWKITQPHEYAANTGYVKTLIEKVGGLELESLITTSKEKFSTYELGDSAIYVEIGKEGGKIDKFYAGKPSDTYTHTYMRRQGSDEVWLVSGSPRSSFSRSPNEWRDKRVLELDRTMINRIVLEFPDEKIELLRSISTPQADTTLAKSDTTWMAHPAKGEPFKPMDKEFNRIMNTCSRLNTVDFLDSGKDTIPDMSRPDFSVEIFLEGNQHEKLSFLPRTTGDTSRWYTMKNDDPNTIFLIYQSSVKNLMKRAEVLKNGEPDVNPRDPSSKPKPGKKKGA